MSGAASVTTSVVRRVMTALPGFEHHRNDVEALFRAQNYRPVDRGAANSDGGRNQLGVPDTTAAERG